MSTTTVSYSSTPKDTSIADLRRRQAEARRAARRVARLEKEQRRREEAIRHRIEAANRIVADQEIRFQEAVAKLDEAAKRLPDLKLIAPSLSNLDRGCAQDPAMLETYANLLKSEIDRFSIQLDDAISRAEQLLQRRIAKAAAWRLAIDLEQQLEINMQRSLEAATHLKETVPESTQTQRPKNEAELEEVEEYITELRQCLKKEIEQREHLCARLATRNRVQALAGAVIETRMADEALARHEKERTHAAQANLRIHRDKTLEISGLCLEDLSGSVHVLIDSAIADAHRQDQRARITRWIAREKQRREGITQALHLMQSPPDMVHDDAALSQRWDSLSRRLQHIASGLEEMTPGIEREYEQIRGDAQRLLNTVFTKSDWMRALSEEGLELLEREDGQGLVVIDLDQPDFWLEVEEKKVGTGGFAAVLTLKTDAKSGDEDARASETFCDKLARVAINDSENIATEAEVIEHSSTVKRSHRPRTVRKSQTQTR